MILEVADIRIAAGKQAEFDAAIKRGVETVIARWRFSRFTKVNQGRRIAGRYLLFIYWASLEAHTWTFVRVRCSPSGVPSLDRSSRSRRWWNTLHAGEQVGVTVQPTGPHHIRCRSRSRPVIRRCRG